MPSSAAVAPDEPPRDCGLCPRLVEYRVSNAKANPDWFNGPVPTFGEKSARLLVVGLAPGVRGANRTGRPFTGDYAGDLLYATLGKYGFSKGQYEARPDDGLTLIDCAITNAVRCVPPENKPTGGEIKTCRPFLSEKLQRMGKLTAILALGRIAHESVVSAFGFARARYPFGHNARHVLPLGDGRSLTLHDSYHCSRYNTNTGRLTDAMFEQVFDSIRETLDAETV